MRAGEQVSPLVLFFDLVFVLAITQCTALMANDGTWRGIAQALVVLGLLWWSWGGYAWLTSVVDPDEGAVRLVLFGSMAALLITSLCVPDAFDSLGTTFAIAYVVVRVAHIALFAMASREDAGLRHSVVGLATSSSVGAALLIGASFLNGDVRLALWAAALAFDMVGPLFIDTTGWRLVPGHFAERHGLIVIVALGESIVAIGVGAKSGVDAGVIAAAILGMSIACAFWWAYFDVASLLAARRLAEIESVQQRNEMARDAYSYIHLAMVAAIVLVALGMKSTLAHVGDPLEWEPAAALIGGASLYLLAHVAFKLRALGQLSVQRLVAGLALLPIIPFAHEIDALPTVALVAAFYWALLAFEAVRFRDARDHIRHPELEH